LGERLSLNNRIDTIWYLQHKQERQLDPLLRLGEDVMHEVLLYVVSLWDIAESKAWRTGTTPRNYTSGPLLLMNVSRRWSNFITESPQLWSYLLIDTDDEEVLEYLQLSLLLSHNIPLFIFLHGSAIVCDAIMVDLLGAGNRIGALVYPPNVSLSTLAMFQFYLGEAHDQQICQWYELEVQSSMQPQQNMNRYSFPTSVQSLWMDGLILLSNLVTLPHFQSLSSLSVRLSVDRGLLPPLNHRLELPNLEKLRVQLARACHHRVDTPILMICKRLKLLDLRYMLEVDTETTHLEFAWMVFDGVDALEELQMDVVVQVVNQFPVDRLADEWLQGLQQMQQQIQQIQQSLEQEKLRSLERERQLEQLERYVQQALQEQFQGQQELRKLELLQVVELQEQELQELTKQQLERRLHELREQKQGQSEVMLQVMLQRELLQREQREQREPREQLRVEDMLELLVLEGERVKLERERDRVEVEVDRDRDWESYQQQQQHLQYREKRLHFLMSMQKSWREWLNLPDHLDHLRHGSMKFVLTSRTHEEEYGSLRNAAETILLSLLLSRLSQLTELTISKILFTFPQHLQKLRLHGFSMPDTLVPIDLPKLVSLEINADGLDHLLIMRYIRVPQLLVLRVQVQDVPGKLRKFDWRDTIKQSLDHISLQINVPRDQQGNYVLHFQFPQTNSLHISSPRPLRLSLSESTPSSYTLRADPGAMSSSICAPSGIDTISANLREDLITEWINPHYGVPSLAKFRTLVSLQQIVLDQRQYMLANESPTDMLFTLLAENIHICPNLTSITISQCPSSWPKFLCQLRRRNRGALLSKSMKCIEELSFYHPLHSTLIDWLIDAIMAKILNVMEWPPTRQGKGWPMRPFEEDDQVFRSCYLCYITGMEHGCLEYETRNVDCGRERGDGSRIYAGHYGRTFGLFDSALGLKRPERSTTLPPGSSTKC
jgi:hypothetical protein